MSKNTYLTRYVRLNDTEELELSVEYSLGTTRSWWDGRPRPRGLKLSITPVKRGEGIKSFKIGDDRGRVFHIKDLKRRSDKQGEQLADWIDARIDDLGKLAVEQDWAAIGAVVFSYSK